MGSWSSYVQHGRWAIETHPDRATSAGVDFETAASDTIASILHAVEDTYPEGGPTRFDAGAFLERARLVKGRKTRDGYLVVTAGLHKLGEQEPYFSVTAELWQSKGWYHNGQGGRCHACGCMHEDILAAFPWLKPVVDLHLSTADGVPMHAEANARYWIEQGKPETAARLLRMPVSDVPNLGEDEFHLFIEALHDRWKEEADAAIRLLDERGAA